MLTRLYKLKFGRLSHISKYLINAILLCIVIVNRYLLGISYATSAIHSTKFGAQSFSNLEDGK